MPASRFADAAALVPYLDALGITRLLLLVVPAGGARQPARLRRRRPDRSQPRSRHGGGLPRVRRRAARARHGPVARRGARTTWASRGRATAGGRTCSRTARAHGYAKVFDIDWQPAQAGARRQGAAARSSATSTAPCSSAARSSWSSRRAPSACATSTRRCRWRRDRTCRSSGTASTRSRASSARSIADLIELLSIITSLERLPAAQRTGSGAAGRTAAGEGGRQAAARRARAPQRGRRCLHHRERAAVQRAIRACRRASTCSTRCSATRPTAWPTGASRRKRSTTGASSTSTSSRRVRMEDPDVFEEAHRLVFRLLQERRDLPGCASITSTASTIRGDYLRRLQARARELGVGDGDQPLFLVVEKILAPDEPLPDDWPVMARPATSSPNAVNGLLVQPANARAFDDIYTRFTGDRATFADLAYQKKKLIMQVSMAGEMNVLAHRLNLFSERNRHYRDFTLNILVHAIREIIACFPVYRTYVTAGSEPVDPRDALYIDRGGRRGEAAQPRHGPPGVRLHPRRAAQARRLHPRGRARRLPAVRHALPADDEPGDRQGHRGHGVLHLQPARLAQRGRRRAGALRRVTATTCTAGSRSGSGSGRRALSATSTHDTKRSEDVRARISVLSEIPGAWRSALARWSRAEQAAPQPP